MNFTSSKWIALLLGVLVLVLAVPSVGVVLARNAPRACLPTSEGGRQGPAGPVAERGLTSEQVELARTIWETALALSDRLSGKTEIAAVIAIAVASQESTLGANRASKVPNADGDAGPFQQRTKPGWYGTLSEVSDPVYATRTFLLGHTVSASEYDRASRIGTLPAGPAGYHLPGLADVPGWEDMDPAQAAHQVQRSRYPQAVADDVPRARQLVADFKRSGRGVLGSIASNSVDGGGCEPETVSSCPATDLPSETGLQPDTLLVLRCTKHQFPKITTIYGVRADPLSDHPSGRAVDLMISSAYANFRSGDAVAYGTSVAEWVKSHQAELGVQYIIWRQHIWNIGRASEGWRPMSDRGNPTANHFDHVHVTTYGNAAKPQAPTSSVPAGAVVPVARYTISARFGQVGSWSRYHTGLDFAASIGTPVRAADGGVVTHAGYSTMASWAGRYVSIRHSDGTSTLYAHLSAATVQPGQTVEAGASIGAIGMTGRTFGPHLHFEAYPRDVEPGDVYRAVDPALWLSRRGAVT